MNLNWSLNLSKRMRQRLAVWMALSLACTFLLTLLVHQWIHHHRTALPSAIHQNQTGSADTATAAEKAERELRSTLPVVPVYLNEEQRIERVPLEIYVRGVVAAEMPISFEPEALKAQALAARTYIVRRLLDQDTSQLLTAPAAQGAVVTNTIQDQAYLSESVLRKKWTGPAAEENLAKLNQAVLATEGQILLYAGQPIHALFFSTSNGYTENAEDYWGDAVPYLQSVASPWDAKLSPRYKETIQMSYKDFLQKLGLPSAITASTAIGGSRVTEWTDAHYVKKIRIGGKAFTGREVRERLGLNSAQFQWKLKGSNVEITTTGYGHGVGMSQWGADGMAMEGKTSSEIVKYYYKGVQIGRVPAALTAATSLPAS